jgi:hypothetical protein
VKKNLQGFSPQEAEFLTHQAQEHFGPDDFDQEVQRHIDQWATPDVGYGLRQESQKEAISALSQGEPPIEPATPPEPPKKPTLKGINKIPFEGLGE